MIHRRMGTMILCGEDIMRAVRAESIHPWEVSSRDVDVTCPECIALINDEDPS